MTKPYAIIIGASGGIGSAVYEKLVESHNVIAISRSVPHLANNISVNSDTDNSLIDNNHDYIQHDFIDNSNSNASISLSAKLESYADLKDNLDTIIIATGILHDTKLGIAPEKRYKNLDIDTMQAVFMTNTFLPIYALKELLPLISRKKPVTSIVLSARVGSISDNQIGGWHTYRASKAALNMYIKTLAIECQYSHPLFKLFAYHPGTVDTDLSEPYSKNTPKDKLFTREQAATYLLNILTKANDYKSGVLIDWRANVISP